MDAQSTLAMLLNDYFAEAEGGGRLKSEKAQKLETAIQDALKERSVNFCQAALFKRGTAATQNVIAKEYDAEYPPR